LVRSPPVDEWAATHCTDVNKPTLACTPDHKLLEKGWITRKRANGDTDQKHRQQTL
jgi:hypothetical protein